MSYPAEPSEFQAQWSSKGGECGALKRAVLAIEKRVGESYVRNQDQVAMALRDAAREIKEMADQASKELDGYIKESDRRRFEINKVLRH